MRNVIVKSSTMVYGCTAPDPIWFDENTPRSGIPDPRSSARWRPSRATYATSPRTTRTWNVALLRFERDRRRHRDAAHPGSRPAVRPVARRVRPPLPVRPRGRRDPLHPLRPEPRPARRLQRRRRRLLLWSEVAAICGKRTIVSPPYGTGLLTAAGPPRHRRPPRGVPPSAALRPRRRQPSAQGPGFPVRVHVGRGGAGVHRGGPAPTDRRGLAELHLRARRRAVLPPLAGGGPD